MTDLEFEAAFVPSRVAVLLKEFAQLDDDREPWRVMYPLSEVLLLLTCATIAFCDDFDDIVAYGKHHLHELRRFAPFHHGIPCVRWMRALVNRVDPVLFGTCFETWVAALWPERHYLIAIDGKTARRTHDSPPQGPQGVAYADRLCQQRPPGARPNERAGKDQRGPQVCWKPATAEHTLVSVPCSAASVMGLWSSSSECIHSPVSCFCP